MPAGSESAFVDMSRSAEQFLYELLSDLWNKERSRGREGRGKKQFREEVVSMVAAALCATVNTREGLLRALRTFGIDADLPEIPDGIDEHAFIDYMRRNADYLIEKVMREVWGSD